jgi:outer membrane protein OmpA-like peptidoglycan-associated protein
MKITVLLVATMFALTLVLGMATIKANSNGAVAETRLKVETKKTIEQQKSSGKDVNPKDIYNDGSSSEEIQAVTKNLEYNFASSAIRPIYYGNLNRLAKVIIRDKYAVSLRGHADSVGHYKPNWMLSEKRAIKVKDYLISQGVDKADIITIPFGSTIPIATNATAAGRQKNRRVEIKLKELSQ